MQHIRHTLGRMVDVALEIDQRGFLFEHALPVAVGYGVYHIVHVLVALADIHVVPDPDHVRHEGNHVGRLPDRLPVGNLALALVQVLHFQTQQVAGGSKGEAGAGGIVPEQGDAQSGFEDLRGDIVLPQTAQRVRHREDRGDLIIRLLPGQEEVALVHFAEIQLVQLVYKLLCFIIHGLLLLI